MFKIVGIVCVSVSIGMYGLYKAHTIKANILFRRSLLELLIHIKNCIDTSGMPLCEIFSSYQNDVLQRAGFLEKLCTGQKDAFETALKECSYSLGEQTGQLYFELAEELGKSKHKKRETELLERFILLIRQKQEALEKDDEAKCVLYSKLGVLCAILFAIILI